MPIRTPLAAALTAISLAYAGNAAAQTDVLVVEGTSVGAAAAEARGTGDRLPRGALALVPRK